MLGKISPITSNYKIPAGLNFRRWDKNIKNAPKQFCSNLAFSGGHNNAPLDFYFEPFNGEENIDEIQEYLREYGSYKLFNNTLSNKTSASFPDYTLTAKEIETIRRLALSNFENMDENKLFYTISAIENVIKQIKQNGTNLSKQNAKQLDGLNLTALFLRKSYVEKLSAPVLDEIDQIIHIRSIDCKHTLTLDESGENLKKEIESLLSGKENIDKLEIHDDEVEFEANNGAAYSIKSLQGDRILQYKKVFGDYLVCAIFDNDELLYSMFYKEDEIRKELTVKQTPKGFYEKIYSMKAKDGNEADKKAIIVYNDFVPVSKSVMKKTAEDEFSCEEIEYHDDGESIKSITKDFPDLTFSKKEFYAGGVRLRRNIEFDYPCSFGEENIYGVSSELKESNKINSIDELQELISDE